MEMKVWYDVPTQVCFWDLDNQCWVGGIAYQDQLICLCCGGVMDLNEMKEGYELFEDIPAMPVREFRKWVSLSDECIGDMMPMDD